MTNMAVEDSDIAMIYEADKVCRTCLVKQKDMKSIFSVNENCATRIVEMLSSCSFLQAFENDGLPTQICHACIENVSRAFKFKQLCNKSDKTLRKSLESSELTFVEVKQEMVTVKQEMLDEEEEDNNYYIDMTSEGNVERSVFVDVNNIENIEEVQEVPAESYATDNIEVDPMESKDSDEQLPQAIEFYACTDCELMFLDVNELHSHTCEPFNACDSDYIDEDSKEVEDDNSTALVCQECGKIFKRKNSLTKHIFMYHPAGGVYTCNVCEKPFKLYADYRIHRKSHMNENGYFCFLCEKAFVKYNVLVQHMRVHWQEKPYKCNLCENRFKHRRSVHEHMRIHDDKYKVKDHICPICDRSLTHSGALQTHIRIHKGERPYVCKVCNKGFPSKSRMTIHERVHTGEKPYQCLYCDKKFSTSSERSKHHKKHSGEKSYKCPNCPKAYTNNSELWKHKKRCIKQEDDKQNVDE